MLRKHFQGRALTARRPFVVGAIVLLVAAAVAAYALQPSGQSRDALKAATQSALDSPGGGEPGEVSLSKVEQYWQTRLTYPTGRFSQRWVTAAAKQAKRIKT